MFSRIRPITLLAVALLATPALTPRHAAAGPLDPPPGPLASTYKTLTDVEPRIAVNATNTPGDNDSTPSLFKITQPGSYYLTSNITGLGGKSGVEIAASGVTLDLMGFTLQGVPSSLDGILFTAQATSGEIRNGHVSSWGRQGVDGSIAVNIRCNDLHTSGNVFSGLRLGHGAALLRCQSVDNGDSGFVVGDANLTTVFGCQVSNCVATRNGAFGFALDYGSTVVNCEANSNGLQSAGVLAGFSLGTSSTIANCTATNNKGRGIAVLSGSLVAQCTTSGTVSLGAGTGTGNGIEANGQSSVLDCTCTENQGSGVAVFGSCTVSRCGLYRNSVNGVEFTGSCLIQGNDIQYNVGAGIRNTGGNNGRIDGNNIVGNVAAGMSFFGTNMLVVRNTARDNGVNYPASAGHSFGPIVNVAGVGDLTGVANSNHPLANLSY